MSEVINYSNKNEKKKRQSCIKQKEKTFYGGKYCQFMFNEISFSKNCLKNKKKSIKMIKYL